MRGRYMAGAVGLGCAGLTVLAMLTLIAPVAAEALDSTRRSAPGRQCEQRSPRDCQMPSDGQCGRRSDCQMPRGEVASDCEDAVANTRPGGSGGLKLTADVADGATVAPGQDIRLRLSWNPGAWSADRLDLAMDCVRVKGALDPDLSAQERPTANDGMFEYRLHVPDNIRPNCDICVQGFLAGPAGDGAPEQVGSNALCFMSGPAGPPETPAPPATPPPAAPPATPTPAEAPPRMPTEVPAQVAGSNMARPAPAPAPAAPAALIGELPRTGHSFAQVGAASAGLTLALGGLALIIGAGQRIRRRPDSRHP